ncbi:hypothetical protein EBR21_14150, partial [bacterium]|nr:hypothetical protein [bacterium]
MAWQVSDGYGGKLTKALIEDACRLAGASKCHSVPNVLVDSGTENLNRHVDHLVQTGIIKRTIAQIDISFSNSMIESFFRTIKHRWLFMLSLDNIDCVRKHVGAFIEDYNSLIPHSALRGATPLEMHLGRWHPAQMDELKYAEEGAREERRIANLNSSCGVCPAYNRSPKSAFRAGSSSEFFRLLRMSRQTMEIMGEVQIRRTNIRR